MLNPSLITALAAGRTGRPGAPDNPAAEQALARAIAALHTFLDEEKDPQDRAAVTQCLARLETIRGKKIPGPLNTQSQQSSAQPGYSQGSGPTGY